jgi:GAF domain-containing protein/multidrug resistance efflux pump
MPLTDMPPVLQGEPADLLDGLSPQRLRQLLRLSHEFNSTLDVDELLPRILDSVAATVGGEAGSIWTVEEDGIVCRAAVGPAAERMVGLELPLGAGVVGDCVARRCAALVNDPASDERFLPQVDAATGYTTQCIIAVPLIAAGEVMGAIQMLNDESGAFDEEDMRFLTAAADDAAAAVRNARLFESEKRAHGLQSLLDLSHEITSTFDRDRIALSIVNLAGRAVRFDRCLLGLQTEAGVRLQAVSGETSLDHTSAALRDAERFMRWAAEQGEMLRVEDVADKDDNVAARIVERFATHVQGNSINGLLAVRVEDADDLLGILVFEFHRPGAFDDWQVEAAQLLAAQAALALRNSQLYADVPFISWLEPLRERRKALGALPAASWVRYALLTVAVVSTLTLVRVPIPVAGGEPSVRAAVQRAARAQVSGVIESVQVREGEWVPAGRVLARVRDDGLLRELAEARGGHAVAVRQALSEDARGNGAAAALARVRAEELATVMALLEARLGEADVTAPEPGRVLTPRAEELVGAFTAAGAPVLWVGDPAKVELELFVAQEDVGLVSIGSRVRARSSAHPGVTFSGRVASIAPAPRIMDGRPAYAARAVLDNGEGLLLPGMQLRARVHTAARSLGFLIFRRPLRWLYMTFWW